MFTITDARVLMLNCSCVIMALPSPNIQHTSRFPPSPLPPRMLLWVAVLTHKNGTLIRSVIPILTLERALLRLLAGDRSDSGNWRRSIWQVQRTWSSIGDSTVVLWGRCSTVTVAAGQPVCLDWGLRIAGTWEWRSTLKQEEEIETVRALRTK